MAKALKNSVKRSAAKKSKTKIISARLSESTVHELHKIYLRASDSEIIANLVEEKLARRSFDEWINALKKGFRPEDLDLDLLK
jgi:hypothetical protein